MCHSHRRSVEPALGYEWSDDPLRASWPIHSHISVDAYNWCGRGDDARKGSSLHSGIVSGLGAGEEMTRARDRRSIQARSVNTAFSGFLTSSSPRGLKVLHIEF